MTITSGFPNRFIVFFRKFNAARRSRRLVTTLSSTSPLRFFRASKIVGHTVNLHKEPRLDGIARLSPIASDDLFFTDSKGERRSKSNSPKSDRFVASVNSGLMWHVFEIIKRLWESNIHHSSNADDLGASLEVAKWGTNCHSATLRNCYAFLMQL